MYFSLQPCRFGISCTNKALCRFSHPSLPQASKLRWTPQIAAAAKDAQQQEDAQPQMGVTLTKSPPKAAVVRPMTAVVLPTTTAVPT